MGEGFYRYYYPDEEVMSAGLDVIEEGYPCAPTISMLMAEKGIDISSQVTTRLNRELVDSVDKVVVMFRREDCPDYLLDFDKANFWYVLDPKGADEHGLRRTRDEIEKGIISKIWEKEKIRGF